MPLPSAVPTVTGEVDPSRLGRTLMHEHVFVLSQELVRNYPASFDDDERVPDAVAKLRALAASGIDTIVDLTVLGLGRDVERVAAVARQADVTVVAATGYYTFDELPSWARMRGPGTLTGGPDPLEDYFVRDIVEGIGDTGIRAGVLKCATDAPGVTPGVERILRAVAAAHLRTGTLISTHTDAATRRGLDQQKVFAEEGVDLTRVVIGHSGDSTDLDYLRAVADQGSTLGMDRFGLDVFGTFADRVDTVARLCALGYADRMVLSHDASCFSHNIDADYRTRELPDWHYTHISDDVLPALRERGVTDGQIHTMLVDNPRRLLGGGAVVSGVDALLTGAVADGVTTGVYAMVADRDGIVWSGGAGTRDGERPWTEDTIAWLASMTKSVVAVAALQLVEQGRVGLDDPVGIALPELAAPRILEGFDGDRPRLRPATAPVTLRGLLSHSAGVGYPFLSPDLVRYHELNGIPSIIECRRSTLVDSPLVAEPGTGFGYSMSIDWVGLLVERLTGTDLETHLREHLFGPLGMDDTGYRIRDRGRLAGMTARLPDGLVAVPFEIPQEPEALSGGAGLYGSPRDYLAFLRMLVGGGTLDGVRVLRADTVAEALSRHTGPIGPMVSIDPQMSNDVDFLPGTEVTWSLLGMRNEEPTPAGRPPGTLAWAGMANSHYWAGPDSAAVLFTQILPFADRPANDLFAAFERAVRGL